MGSARVSWLGCMAGVTCRVLASVTTVMVRATELAWGWDGVCLTKCDTGIFVNRLPNLD